MIRSSAPLAGVLCVRDGLHIKRVACSFEIEFWARMGRGKISFLQEISKVVNRGNSISNWKQMDN